MRIVCLSDTHNRHRAISVPDGDVLIHAGDFTNTGSVEETSAAMSWVAELPHRHRIVIGGNHDWIFEREPEVAAKLIPPHVHYLCDSGCVIEGLRIWGSPVQPRFLDWAFNRDRGSAIEQHWAMIPENTDVLITHGPPFGRLDLTRTGHCGCESLLRRLSEVRPKLHVFGHIHGAYGVDVLGPTLLVNAATCNEAYRPVHPPIVINMEGGSCSQVL